MVVGVRVLVRLCHYEFLCLVVSCMYRVVCRCVYVCVLAWVRMKRNHERPMKGIVSSLSSPSHTTFISAADAVAMATAFLSCQPSVAMFSHAWQADDVYT